MADRVGVIDRGRLLLVEDKATLMRRMGRKELRLVLQAPLAALPESLAGLALTLSADGTELVHAYDSQAAHADIAGLLRRIEEAGIGLRDIHTRESSLEDIFVDLVRNPRSS